MLVFGGFVAVALQFAMVDPRERLSVQCAMVGAVAAIVAAGLIVVYFLDHPYQNHAGGIEPTAMRQTLVMVDELQPAVRASLRRTGDRLRVSSRWVVTPS